MLREPLFRTMKPWLFASGLVVAIAIAVLFLRERHVAQNQEICLVRRYAMLDALKRAIAVQHPSVVQDVVHVEGDDLDSLVFVASPCRGCRSSDVPYGTRIPWTD